MQLSCRLFVSLAAEQGPDREQADITLSLQSSRRAAAVRLASLWKERSQQGQTKEQQ